MTSDKGHNMSFLSSPVVVFLIFGLQHHTFRHKHKTLITVRVQGETSMLPLLYPFGQHPTSFLSGRQDSVRAR
jgi:hypothetical protein